MRARVSHANTLSRGPRAGLPVSIGLCQLKKCFATDYPLLQWDRVLREVDSLELSPEVRQRFLHDNGRAAFKLPA